MMEKYIQTYGNAYEIPSPDNNELMKILVGICKENNIICNAEECFEYLREFPDTYEQMTLF